MHKFAVFSSSSKIQSGFSLVELMVVVGIIGFLAVIAAPNFNAIIDGIQLYTTVNGIKHQLKCAKTRALGDSQLFCGVYLDTATSQKKLKVFLDNGTPVNNGRYDAGSDRHILGDYLIPATLSISFVDSYGNREIVFRGDGSTCIQGVTITLKSKRNKIRKISVIPSTGRIKVVEQ
jgi:prepilin-type N-terminal cleavage/methylation domain-containing protein